MAGRRPGGVVVVGGGVAGFATVQELRRLGHGGAITLVDPQGEPYDRPPLSKGYLAGDVAADSLGFVDAAWFTDHEVDLVTARAERLVPAEGVVLLADGRRLSAETVVLATGGVPRRLAVPGGDADGVLTLRTRADADRLRDHLAAGRPLAVVGAGLIGAEVASTAARAGVGVTLVDAAPLPLAAVVGPDLARELHAMHARAGVATVTATPAAVRTRGTGLALALDGAPDVEADAVLVAVGIEPDTTLAASAGLAVADGVLVDERQRTANPAVLAVGDAARTRPAGGPPARRQEHWEAAMRQGVAAAATLVGAPAPAPSAPWFWSDRHGVHVEVVGDMSLPGRDVVRAVDGVPAMAFRVGDDGLLAGCAAIDGGIGVRAARRIIDRRLPVDADQLADASVPLKRLAR